MILTLQKSSDHFPALSYLEYLGLCPPWKAFFSGLPGPSLLLRFPLCQWPLLPSVLCFFSFSLPLSDCEPTASCKVTSPELCNPIYTVQAWKSNHDDFFFTTHTVIRSGFESSALYIQSPSSVSLIECLTGHKSNLKLPASILTSSPDPLRPHSLSKADSISPVDWVKSLSISDSSPFSWSKLNLWEENLTWPLAVSNFC